LKRRALAITTLLAGCAAALGPAALIGTDAEPVGVKLVRPGACRDDRAACPCWASRSERERRR